VQEKACAALVYLALNADNKEMIARAGKREKGKRKRERGKTTPKRKR
jgi:hypothetical protein